MDDEEATGDKGEEPVTEEECNKIEEREAYHAVEDDVGHVVAAHVELPEMVVDHIGEDLEGAVEVRRALKAGIDRAEEDPAKRFAGTALSEIPENGRL